MRRIIYLRWFIINKGAFNFHYNFIVNCLDDFLDNVGVKDDFYLSENPSQSVLKNGVLLICNIFDDYYELVRIRRRTFDPSKTRSNRPVELKSNFYNPLIIQNKKNIKRFSAVPFSESALKSIVSDVAFNTIKQMTQKETLQQVAFGIKECMEFAQRNGDQPSFVIE
jgi:hypothetical protein